MDKKRKSRFFPILGVTILVLLVLIIVVPFLLKDQLADKALELANDNINAEIGIGKVSLSIFKSFPDLHFGLEGLTLSGSGNREGEELARIGSLRLDINLKSALKKEIQINSIVIDQPEINAHVFADGKANWDIGKSKSQDEEEAEEVNGESVPAAFSVLMQDLRIIDARIGFTDEKQEMSLKLEDLDLGMQGDFSTIKSELDLQATIGKINFEQNGVGLLKDVSLEFLAVIGIDLENMFFTFQENNLTLNELDFDFDGSVGLNADGSIDTDVSFSAKQADFGTLLSFIPAVYMEGFEELRTEGSLKFEGFAKGRMIEETLPEFGLDLLVKDGMVQYPELPGAIHDINIDVKVTNPGGEADNTKVAINRFELFLADNPVSADLSLSEPVSDPLISANVDLDVNLATLKKVIPLEGMSLSGIVTSNMSLNTRMSTIEEQEYEKVKLKGGLELDNMVIHTKGFTKPVHIQKAELSLTPQYVILKQFRSRILETDLSLSGKVENFIPFALQDKTLIGELDIDSRLINANQLMSLSATKSAGKAEEKKDDSTDSATSQRVVIPENIEMKLNCGIDRILFDQMEISNLTGTFDLKEAVADLNNLRFDIFKGGIRVTGKYNGKETEPALTEGTLKLWKLNIDEAFKSVSVLQQTMPVLEYSSGEVSGNIDINAKLDKSMQPVMESINSEGSLQTSSILIEGSPVLEEIAANLKNPNLKKVRVSAIDASYTMTNGNLNISPFTTEFSKSSAIIFGTVSVEEEMDISINTRLSVEDLGIEARNQINNLIDQINKTGFIAEAPEYIDVPVKITGSTTDPQVSLDWITGFAKLIENLRGQLQNRLEEKVKEEGKDILEDKANKLLKGLFK